MSDLGVDINCDGDLDPLFGLVSGRECLIQAVHHRYQTARGTLVDDADYGFEVRAWINETLSPARIFALQIGLETEALKDERVLSCSATVTFVSATNSLRFTLAIVDADGPFELVLEATSLTVELLSVTHGA